MDLNIRLAGQSDNDAIRALLLRLKLPAESVGEKATTVFVATEAKVIIGVAGFEFYGDDGLLRSVAVAPTVQKNGVGTRLTDFMIATARGKGMKRIVLLTETAENFFAKKGFKTVDRASIANEILRQSSEFAYACPTSAVCMVLDLQK